MKPLFIFMRNLTVALALLIILALVWAFQKNQDARELSLLVPEPGQYYHGVYPGGKTGEEDDISPEDLNAYVRAAGRNVAWVYFSNNWYSSRAFPLETAQWIRDAGAVPYIRLMLRSSIETDQSEPLFTLEAIKSGHFDADLRSWAQAAASFKTPIMVEYGTEVNGNWFPWNAKWNGKETGAALFQEAYRHIITLMQEESASNLIWGFHIDAYDDPQTQWNRLEAYYPGDDYIDFIGISAYGVQSPQDKEWGSFTEAMNDVMPRLAELAPDKAVYVVEFGSSLHPRLRASDWADEALTNILANRWPAIRGFSWWNETWQNDANPAHDSDFRVQSVPGLS
ncbi:MAG: hypothetical protein KC422_03265, partial [Trueperaceae bacterium]|nr:hypothetical protein [Trueperaceae bacterium]